MIQPNKHGVKPKKKVPFKRIRNHPKYGTSKLEEDFAHQFLDQLNVDYVYQFEAKDIGRFYDFYLPNENLLIEIDGDYWHGNPDKYSQDELRYHQRKAQRVDEYKNKWALMHSIPIIRIWESDIRKRPKQVMDGLKTVIRARIDEESIKRNKKIRH